MRLATFHNEVAEYKRLHGGDPRPSADRALAEIEAVSGEGTKLDLDLQTRLNDYVTWMRRRGHYQADARALDARLNAERTEAAS